MRILGALMVWAALVHVEFAFAQAVDSTVITVGSLRVHKTRKADERVPVLPLPKRIPLSSGGGLQEQYQVIFTIPVAGLSERDVLQVAAEMEVTNDCGYDVAFGTWLVIAGDPARTVPDTAKGDAYLAYPAGYNITNGNYQLPGAGDRSFMHHGTASRSAVYVVPKGLAGTRYVNFVAYAQTDKLDCRKGAGLTVEKGSGQMSVMHFSSGK